MAVSTWHVRLIQFSSGFPSSKRISVGLVQTYTVAPAAGLSSGPRTCPDSGATCSEDSICDRSGRPPRTSSCGGFPTDGVTNAKAAATSARSLHMAFLQDATLTKFERQYVP